MFNVQYVQVIPVAILVETTHSNSDLRPSLINLNNWEGCLHKYSVVTSWGETCSRTSNSVHGEEVKIVVNRPARQPHRNFANVCCYPKCVSQLVSASIPATGASSNCTRLLCANLWRAKSRVNVHYPGLWLLILCSRLSFRLLCH